MSKPNTLSDTVAATLDPLVSSSADGYRRYIFFFIDFLETEVDWLGIQIPQNVLDQWTPFVEKPNTKTSTWRINPNIPALLLNEVTVDRREKFVESRNLAAGTSKFIRSVVNKLMIQAHADGDVNAQVIETLGAYKTSKSKKPRQTIDVSIIRQLRLPLLNSPEVESLRKLVCLDLMLYMGFRQADLLNLTMGDIVVQGGDMWMRSEEIVLKVNAIAQGTIERYIEATGRKLGESDGGETLIRGKTGANLGDRSLRYIFQSIFVGAFSEYNPDDLRRTAALNALENGASIPIVQTMLRIKTTSGFFSYMGMESSLIKLPNVTAYINYD